MCKSITNTLEHGNAYMAWSSVKLVSVWPIDKLRVRRVLLGHTRKITCITWHPDSRCLVAVDQSGNVVLWDAMKKMKLQFMSKQLVMAAAISPDPDKILVALGGLDNVISLCDMSPPEFGPPSVPKELPSTGEGHDSSITSLRFTSMDTLVSASGDGEIRVWDVQTGCTRQVLAGHTRDVTSLSFPRDAASGPVFASCSLDGSVRIWDMRSGATTASFDAAAEINVCCMFPNGTAVAAGCADGSIKVFDVRSQQCVWQVQSDKQSCTGIEFSASGRGLYTSHESGFLGCWEAFGPNTGCKQWIPAHTSAQSEKDKHISGFSLSPDGTAFATCSYDSVIKIWGAQQVAQ